MYQMYQYSKTNNTIVSNQMHETGWRRNELLPPLKHSHTVWVELNDTVEILLATDDIDIACDRATERKRETMF